MSRTPLEHARHNADACKYLDQDGSFNDWVVTTAFYAALHYVEEELFPLSTRGETYDSFDEYCRENPSTDGKHKRRSNLVQRHLITLSGQYNWLKDQAWTARYNDYQTSDRLKRKALEHLGSIRAYCDPDDSAGHAIPATSTTD